MGKKNWPKSAKKRQKEPKFDFSALGPLCLRLARRARAYSAATLRRAPLHGASEQKIEFWLFLAFFGTFWPIFFAHFFPLTNCDKSLQ